MSANFGNLNNPVHTEGIYKLQNFIQNYLSLLSFNLPGFPL